MCIQHAVAERCAVEAYCIPASNLAMQILMNWSQEELEQWTVTQQQKEEDSEAIERYAEQDRAKVKELDLAITRMNRTVAAHKGDLQREVTDTQSVQMQLRKAADDFENLHKASVLPSVCCNGSQVCAAMIWARTARLQCRSGKI